MKIDLQKILKTIKEIEWRRLAGVPFMLLPFVTTPKAGWEFVWGIAAAAIFAMGLYRVIR